MREIIFNLIFIPIYQKSLLLYLQLSCNSYERISDKKTTRHDTIRNQLH